MNKSEFLFYQTYKCIQAYGRKGLNISTPSLISACFFISILLHLLHSFYSIQCYVMCHTLCGGGSI